MAYNQFSLQRAVADFGLTIDTPTDLFPHVPTVPTPARYRDTFVTYRALANNEAGRSHFLVAPLLGEVWQRGRDRLALFVATRFDVDEAAGLTGVCDFILGRPPQLPYVTAPVMMIVEAKFEDIWGGTGQCAAAMVAAQRFNAGRTPPVRDPMYGAVTDGERWRFLRLHDDRLDIEAADRLVSELDHIFGILLHIVGLNPAAPATPVAA